MSKGINIEEIETQFEIADKLESYQSIEYTDLLLEQHKDYLQPGFDYQLYFMLFQSAIMLILYIYSSEYDLNNRYIFIVTLLSLITISHTLNRLIARRAANSIKQAEDDVRFLDNFNRYLRITLGTNYYMVLMMIFIFYDPWITFLCFGIGILMLIYAKLIFKNVMGNNFVIRTEGIHFHNVELSSIEIILSKIGIFGARKYMDKFVVLLSSASLKKGLTLYPDDFGKYFLDLVEIIIPTKQLRATLKYMIFYPVMTFFLSWKFYETVSTEYSSVYLLYISNIIILPFLIGMINLHFTNHNKNDLSRKLTDYFDEADVKPNERINILKNIYEFLRWHTIVDRTLESNFTYPERVVKAYFDGNIIDTHFSILASLIE